MCICIYVCGQTHTNTQEKSLTWKKNWRNYSGTHTHTHTHIYIHTYTHIYICVCVYIYINIYTHTHTYIYIYTHTHIKYNKKLVNITHHKTKVKKFLSHFSVWVSWQVSSMVDSGQSIWGSVCMFFAGRCGCVSRRCQSWGVWGRVRGWGADPRARPAGSIPWSHTACRCCQQDGPGG